MTVRLWSSVTPSGGVLAPSTNTLYGDEFEVSAQQGVYGVWWYSASGALTLPAQCGVWNLDTQSLVCQSLSPSWSGAAGSGWVSCSFPGSDLVNSGTHYAVAVFGGSGSNWRYHTPSYWTTGTGSSGISNGVLSAPSNASALLGQSVGGGTGSWSCPTSGAAGQNYWVDVEVGAALVPTTTSGSAAMSSLAMSGSATVVPRAPGQGSAASSAPSASSALSLPSVTPANALGPSAAPSQASPQASAANFLNGSASTGDST